MTISLTILTSTPTELRDRMIARGIMKIEDGEIVGAHSGTEWLEVPNPIVVTPASGTPGDPGYVPPVMDARKAYMVKFAHEALAADDSGDADDEADDHPRFTRSKLVQWIKANGSPATLNSADGQTFRTWKLGTKFWIIHPADQGALGVWQ